MATKSAAQKALETIDGKIAELNAARAILVDAMKEEKPAKRKPRAAAAAASSGGASPV